MEINKLFENRETKETKISETLHEGKLSDPEYKNVLREQLGTIKSSPLESLREQNNRLMRESNLAKPGLSEDEKKKVKEAHPDWPDEIIDAIGSWEEYEIYHKAGLQAEEINGKWCLVRSDIDWNQKDEWGRTNKERAEQGLAPLDKNGKPIELHHIGQKPDSPLAELTQEEHRGKGNDGVLHDKNKETEIDRIAFSKEKDEHWETRANEVQRSSL